MNGNPTDPDPTDPPEWFISLMTWMIILIPTGVIFGLLFAVLLWKCGWPSEGRCH